jgi:3-methyladenine DNA glycosylase AlkD
MKTSKPDDRVAAVVTWLERTGSARVRDGMARYGLPSDRAFGVPIGVMQRYAREIGRSHELALGLWDTGWYEARIVAAFVGEPDALTPAQMDRWCRDFDNWGICDTVCFHLFDRSPHAWRKIAPWSRRRDEFGKRAAFALLACLALHDKTADEGRFRACLPLIERAASDDRNFVKKGVSWALRLIGRRSIALNAAAVALARRLAASPDPAARWIGKGAVRELTSAAVRRRLKAAAARRRPRDRRR